MRKTVLLAATLFLSASALAWVPKLDEATAKSVIDGVYGRRDPVQTYLTLDLSVKEGKFAAGEGVVSAFDGGESCVADWLAAPADYSKGSRVSSLTLSGQADQLYVQAQSEKDSFKSLSAAEALGADYAAKRMADGEVRVDIAVRGLPTEKTRDAYQVRLKAPDGKLLAPTRRTYVNDFKQDAGLWSGTLVYYFKPLDAGVGASDKLTLLLRTEADTKCAFAFSADLSQFQ